MALEIYIGQTPNSHVKHAVFNMNGFQYACARYRFIPVNVVKATAENISEISCTKYSCRETKREFLRDQRNTKKD